MPSFVNDPNFTAAALFAAAAEGKVRALELEDISELEALLLDENGVYINAVPAEQLAAFSHNQRSLFCVKHGVYQFVTSELIEYLSLLLSGESIEVAGGCGLIGECLGIVSTDNFMQTWPDISEHYARARQGVVKYGPHVQLLDAEHAKNKLKPDTIITAWITGKTSITGRPKNSFGPNLKSLAKDVKFIMIGNEATHGDATIFARNCWEVRAPWILSRSQSPELNRLWVWGERPPAELGATVTRRRKRA